MPTLPVRLYTMPVDKERQAVVVGVGRFTQRPAPVEDCVTPVGMFAQAARRAAVDVCAPLKGSIPGLLPVPRPRTTNHRPLPFILARSTPAVGSSQPSV